MLKKAIFILASVIIASQVPAQGQVILEHDFSLNLGMQWESLYVFPLFPTMGGELGLSYGLDVRYNDNWSVVPGAEASAYVVASSSGGMVIPFADIYCLSRHRKQRHGVDMAVGFGPELMFIPIDGTVDSDIESLPGWTIVAPKQFTAYQLGLKHQTFFYINDHIYMGMELNVGVWSIVSPYLWLYFNTLRFCTGIRL